MNGDGFEFDGFDFDFDNDMFTDAAPTSEFARIPRASRPRTAKYNNASAAAKELGVLNEGETVDFCMCNPPFFASAGAACPPHLALPTLILVCPLFFFTLGLEWESFMLADIVGCF